MSKSLSTLRWALAMPYAAKRTGPLGQRSLNSPEDLLLRQAPGSRAARCPRKIVSKILAAFPRSTWSIRCSMVSMARKASHRHRTRSGRSGGPGSQPGPRTAGFHQRSNRNTYSGELQVKPDAAGPVTDQQDVAVRISAELVDDAVALGRRDLPVVRQWAKWPASRSARVFKVPTYIG